MMTGFGYEAHTLPSGITGMEEDCGNRSEFYNGAGLSNSDYYGYLGGHYEPQVQWSNAATTSAAVPTTSLAPAPALAPAAAPAPALAPAPAAAPATTATVTMPHASISDEELYQALNISPMAPLMAQTMSYHPYSPMTLDFNLGLGMNVQTVTASCSDYCYPSSSTLDSVMPSYEPYNSYDSHASMYLSPDDISRSESSMRDTLSPTFSIHSYAPTTTTANAEEEDLEVELINSSTPQNHHSFADELDILLHSGALNDDFRTSKEASFSRNASNNPTPSERPPYAKKLSLSSQKNSIDTCAPTTSAALVHCSASPLYLQTSLEPTGFTPLLTPKSDALLQRKLSEANHKPPIHIKVQRRDSFPTALIPESILKRGIDLIQFDGYKPLFSTEPYDNVFDHPHNSLHTTPERHAVSRDRSFSKDFPTVQEEFTESASDNELDNQSEEVAVDAIERLFCGPPDVIDSPVQSLEELLRGVSQQTTLPSEVTVPAPTVIQPKAAFDCKMEDVKQNEVKSNNDDVLDDWETANDDDLTDRMEKMMIDAKAKVVTSNARNAQASVPSTSESNVEILPHVLALHSIPDYKMKEDVVKSLELIGFNDCTVVWIERKIVFVVFENERRAKCCACNLTHDWLRFQTLRSAPKFVQDAAQENISQLSAPKRRTTNASVARRMVENVLGQKSSVSAEQRQKERKQIADAKAAKKNGVKWD